MKKAIVFLIVSIGISWVVAATPRTITMDDRIVAQRAIEEVYWRHRIWPKENPGKKPPLDAVMPASAIRAKVNDYLQQSNALDALWHRPITPDQLQAELDRIGRDSRDRNTLREIVEALGNDPFLIAETLARETLVDRLIRSWHGEGGTDLSFETWWAETKHSIPMNDGLATTTRTFALPVLDPGACTPDTWSPTAMDVPDGRYEHVAVWTGAEMIVWGGENGGIAAINGGRYDPATDSWRSTSLGPNVPALGLYSTAVWTGTEMIVWGGQYTDQVGTSGITYEDKGARYDPATDTWRPTSMGANTPVGRMNHTAIWTGTEMVIWGGRAKVGGIGTDVNTGGRYDPVSDSWMPTGVASTTPKAREGHTAVWTGTRMIVWGGSGIDVANSGAIYDPVADTWVPTSTGVGAPSARSGHLAVWTGSLMIVWGGQASSNSVNTGGRYDPATDSWQSTSIGSGVPTGDSSRVAVWTGSRMIVANGAAATYDPLGDTWSPIATGPSNGLGASAVWTGTEMIVWGGLRGSSASNTGFRYSPAANSWIPTRTMQAAPPAARGAASVWTGTEMIVWGGWDSTGGGGYRNTGGRYRPATDSWMPTSTGAGVPPPRELATGVWTGSEMIVWGGNGNGGGRYDPTSDAWVRTSDIGAPSNRWFHTAVWTGREMIVWGGSASNSSTNTGGRYDPRTDTWRATSTDASVPVPRADHVAVWTGSRMIVWGGTGATNTGGQYDPATDSWVATSTGPNVPIGRQDASAVWTGEEMIVWGGCCTKNSGGRYDPVSDTWQPTSIGAGVPTARSVPTAVWTGNRMIVFGGSDTSHYPRPSGGALYDPSLDSWSPMTDWSYPSRVLILGSAVWTGSSMAVWGGDPSTAQGALYCACPSGQLFYRDADGDGYGDPGVSMPSCDGTPPAGYVADATDCNDAAANTHPGAAEVCDGVDNNCDGVIDEGPSGFDADGDLVAGACDNCPFVFNPTQSDSDHDGEGDACDLNDGEIWQWRDDKTSVSWQAEQGPTEWNVYTGDLAVLRATGVYTQGDQQCHLESTVAADTNDPAPGSGTFTLVTGVTGGVEGSLGNGSMGPRPNTNPCP
ncbi:MAG TPA: MopE-related protein [Candidatus Polarisedimenticolaceae bacterium]|nr:MopE-related protein [Candidatus Polarisedimenticolaceae bacterium]